MKFQILMTTVSVLILTGVALVPSHGLVQTETTNHDTITKESEKSKDTLSKPLSFKPQQPTSSSVILEEDNFNEGAMLSFAGLIQGHVPGMRISRSTGMPGGYSTFSIRGATDLSGYSTPLYVIDGVELDPKYFRTIENPLLFMNVEDIRRITVIRDVPATTAYGSRGADGVIVIDTRNPSADTTLHVRYRGELALANNPSTIPVMDAPAYRELMQERYTDNQIVQNDLGNANTDWQDAIFSPGFQHDHYVALSGSINPLSLPFHASVGYNNNEGTIKTTSLERTTASLRLTPSYLDNHLKADINIKGADYNNRVTDVESGTSYIRAFKHALKYNPTQPVYDEDSPYGNYNVYTNDSTPIADAPLNPVELLEMLETKNNHQEIFADMGLEYRFHFLPDLQIKANYSINNYEHRFTYFEPGKDVSWFEYNDEYKVNNKSDMSGRQFRGRLHYSKLLRNIDAGVDLKAGYSNQNQTIDTKFTTKGYKADSLVRNDRQHSTSDYTLTSYYATAAVHYKNRYFMKLTYLHDGTSLLAEDNRWQGYPGISLAWKLNKEPFFGNSQLFNSIKLRAGYGKSGRMNLNATYPGDALLDYDLKMPSTTSTNACLSFSMLNNRLNGKINWYHRNSKDIIIPVPVPDGTGTTTHLLNSGSISNEGFELALNGLPVKQKHFQWRAGINFSSNSNKIEAIYPDDVETGYGTETGYIEGGIIGTSAMIQRVGEPLRSFFMYSQKERVGNPIPEELIDENGDGYVNIKDKTIQNNPYPDFSMGFYSDIHYKQLDISFSGRVWSGNYVFNNVAYSHSRYSMLSPNSVFVQNITTQYDQHIERGYEISDFYLEDASFLKIDQITLGYNLKNIYAKKMHLRIYASIQNVLTITGYKGLDPEIPSGIDYLRYPVPQIFRLGINAKL